MDKGVFKDVMRAHGLPLAEYVVLSRREVESDLEAVADRCEALAPYPLFVKPANLGSSVGITKAHNRAELLAGLRVPSMVDSKQEVAHILVDRALHPQPPQTPASESALQRSGSTQ
jgi:D-alanine-D-alanine ligase